MKIVIQRSFIVCFLLFFVLAVSAQTHDFGGVVGAEYEKKIGGGFAFSSELEGRFDHCFTSFNRLKVGASFDYTFFRKHFKVGAFANYLLSNEHSYFENRGKIGGFLTYNQPINNFSINYRVRVQSLFYDETHKDHKYNPKTYLRNRLQIEYDLFHKPVKIYASTEFFLRLYQRENCFIDAFRTILGVQYRFNRNSAIDIYFRADNEIQVSSPTNCYYIGVAYKFKH